MNKRIFTLPFILILIINTFNGLASYMVNPSLPDYLISKGATMAMTGVISSLLSWVALIIRPVSGVASDRLDRKKLLLFSYAAVTASLFLYSIAPGVRSVVAIRIRHGIFFSLAGTAAMVFSTQYIPRERLGEGLGYLSLSTLISTMIGPQAGTIVADRLSMNMVFICAGVAELICTVMVLLLQYKQENRHQTVRKSIQISELFASELWVYVLLISLFSFGNGIVSYYLKKFGAARGIDNITAYYTVNSLMLLLIKPLSGKLHDRKGIAFILYPAYLITAAGMLIMANAHSLIMVIIVACLKAIGQGSGSPAIQAESVRMLGNDRKGVAVSTCYIGMDIGNAVGPVFAGFTIERFGYQVMWTLYAVLLLSGVVMFHLYNHAGSNEKRMVIKKTESVSV
ncbi:MAG: MFS transporter [Erysipelotrichaceae bacterium]|nr:MFS transporter [Erysipelotrichaceae bacterium]